MIGKNQFQNAFLHVADFFGVGLNFHAFKDIRRTSRGQLFAAGNFNDA